MGSLHTVRDKLVLGLFSNDTIVCISRDDLAEPSPVVAQITARSVVSELIGLRVDMNRDLSPKYMFLPTCFAMEAAIILMMSKLMIGWGRFVSAWPGSDDKQDEE